MANENTEPPMHPNEGGHVPEGNKKCKRDTLEDQRRNKTYAKNQEEEEIHQDEYTPKVT